MDKFRHKSYFRTNGNTEKNVFNLDFFNKFAVKGNFI